MDTLRPHERSARMRLIRCKDTGPELAVRRLVYGMGYRYRLHLTGVPGRPDIAFSGRRKAIFVHGCFWHSHSCSRGRLPKWRLEFWQPKLEANRRRDRRTLRRLRGLGWRILVVWECQLRDSAVLANRLRGFLDA
jgi:DNA mismatch endonuclease (patch repair protein)